MPPVTTSSQPPEDCTRLDPEAVAINMNFTAYEHQLINRTRYQKLVYSALRDIRGAPKNEACSPLPTEAELDTVDSDNVGLWVGIYLQSDEHTTAARIADKRAGKAKSNFVKGGFFKDIKPKDVVQHDKRALRVIVPCTKRTATYYFLVDPDERGICSGIKTTFDHVFFFDEFRTDSNTSIQQRKAEWPALIRPHANISERGCWSTPASDLGPRNPEPVSRLSIELDKLIDQWLVKGPEASVQRAIQLQGDVNSAGLDVILWVHFIGGDHELTFDQAQAVFDQFKNLMCPDLDWSTITDVGPQQIQRASKALRTSGISLEYHYVRTWIFIFCDLLADSMLPEDHDTVQLARKAHERAIRQAPPAINHSMQNAQPPSSIRGLFYRTLAANFRDMSNFSKGLFGAATSIDDGQMFEGFLLEMVKKASNQPNELSFPWWTSLLNRLILIHASDRDTALQHDIENVATRLDMMAIALEGVHNQQ